MPLPQTQSLTQPIPQLGALPARARAISNASSISLPAHGWQHGAPTLVGCPHSGQLTNACPLPCERLLGHQYSYASKALASWVVSVIGNQHYALFCPKLRRRRSTNASMNSSNGIPESAAIRSKVLRLGEDFPFSHSDQFFTSTPVRCFSSLYDRCKNSSLFIGEFTNIAVKIGEAIKAINCVVGLIANIAQTAKHPLTQVLAAISSNPCKEQGSIQLTYEYTSNGTFLGSPSRCMAPFSRGRPTPLIGLLHREVWGVEGVRAMSWREESLEIINTRIHRLSTQTNWDALSKVEKQRLIKKAVDTDYPYSERSGWAYQAWLNARADIFAEWGIPTRRKKPRPPANRKGWRKPIEVAPGQTGLFDEQCATHEQEVL